MPTDCPSEDCESVYDCDACLDVHLRSAHGASYAGVFGASPEGWLGTCGRHRQVPVSRLGGVEPVTPAAARTTDAIPG